MAITEEASRRGGGDPVVVATGIVKSYPSVDDRTIDVLRGVDLEVRRGEVVAVTGESGAGKSTLLHVLGALDRPTGGEVRVADAVLTSMAEAELSGFRNRHIGFVFQFHHLLRAFSAVENVMMPQLIGGTDHEAARERAESILSRVGLSHRLGHMPGELSGGEQQRVAVARALANRPSLLLADEPSGNLDERTSDRLHDLLFSVAREEATAMVLITHNRLLAARADRELRIVDGALRPAEQRPVDEGAAAARDARR